METLLNITTQERIRRRAYELYSDRGELPGHDQDDWFQAEREIILGAVAQERAAAAQPSAVPSTPPAPEDEGTNVTSRTKARERGHGHGHRHHQHG